MLNVISLQIVTLLIVSIGAAFVVGVHGAISALLGGGASILPNLFFALHLQRLRKHAERTYFVLFLFGEVAKMGLTAVLISMSAVNYSRLHWPSFMVALASASLIILLALLKKTRTDKNYVDN